MRIITCASFYQTGSSAVTDFFTEFDDICSLGIYEYRFLQEPDGIADLEYNLVENPHRHNSSDAVKRFLRYMKNLQRMGYGGYDIFEGQFLPLTDRFVEEIVRLKAHSWWNKDRIDKGRWFYLVDRIYSLGMRILTGNLRTSRKFSLLTHREWGYYTDIEEEEFLEAVRRYIRRLVNVVNKEDKPLVMIDQMVPPINTRRFVRYFDDVKIIVVNRDPRDIYLYTKCVSKLGIIPDEVHDFVEWFRITRKYADASYDDPTKVLRINFEDLGYQYDRMEKVLTEFVGADIHKHHRKYKKLNPETIRENSNLKERYSQFEADIRYIEENLTDYLYHFS